MDEISGARLGSLARTMLVFSVAVVMLASASFLFGGCCAVWQWWLAAAVAVASGGWRRPVCEGARGAFFFLAWLGVFWVGSGVFAGAAWWDEVAYHYPAVRMLIEGWNPIRDCTPESALAAVGLNPGDLWIDHVVFMPKIVWVFGAEAWFFTKDALNPLSPILWFLFPAVVVRIWRSMSDAPVVWRLLAVPLLYCLVPNAAYAVDAVVALSAIGLFLTFEEVLSDRGFDPLSMVAYSFWMMGSKTPGLLHGGFFWAVFLSFVLWRRRGELKRLLCVVAATAPMLALANATPYLTSVREYGHPFYPKYSFDEGRYPVRDLTQDFLSGRNDDAAQMGYCGLYVNAFVSPSLARAWYRWRLGRPDFMPYSQNYTHYPNDPPVLDGSCPTRFRMRILFWLSLAWLFAGAGKSWRVPALSVLLCTGAAPSYMLGYVRYVPWWLAPALFAYVDFSRRPGARSRRTLCTLALAFTCTVGPQTLLDRLAYAASRVERRVILADVLEGGGKPPALRPAIPIGMGQLRLLFRQMPLAQPPEQLPFSQRHRDAMEREGLEISALLFVMDDMDEMRRKSFRYPRGLWRRAVHAVEMCFVTLPRAVAARLAAAPWHDHGKGARK